MNSRKSCIKKKVLGVIGLLSVFSTTVFAEKFKPIIDYDFATAKDCVIQNAGTANLDLLIQGKIKDGALYGEKKKSSSIAKDSKTADKWLNDFSANNISVAFWIRPDKLPSGKSPTGLFDVTVDKDGYLEITLFGKDDELLGNYTMRSKRQLKRKEWAHVEFN